jgi:eukaryotic-like serine/threonine-protein kinase
MTIEQDRVGQQADNYTLVSKLGKGGFSEVYLAEHLYLNTQAAIKILSVRLLESEQKAFFDEARIVAHLDHPHIVRVLDFGLIDHVPFLVMEYAPNGTLRKRHPRGTIVPLTAALSYVEQIASALQYAHDKQLIHRDVKPSNMLIDKKDEILLSDFGTALALQSSITVKREEMMVGTPAYTAPEQLQGNAVFASDQYALAMVTYEWLTGKRPFSGTFEEVARMHLRTSPPSLRAQVPDIPLAVERVIFKALEKRPEQRFGSVREFAVALKEARVMDEPATIILPPERAAPPLIVQAPTQPIALPPITTRRGPSRRVVIGGLAGLGVLAAGGGIAWFALSARPPLPALATHTSTPGVHTAQPSQNMVYLYTGHHNAVNSVAWSPEGARIASASVDQTVQIWDAANGANVFIYRGHFASVRDAVWEPKSGSRIASASRDKTVQVWDAVNGAHVTAFHSRTNIVPSASWSPDASRVASVDYASVHIWASASAAQMALYKAGAGRINAVAWSPDDAYIAAGNASNEVQLWDVASGRDAFVYRGHGDEVKDIAWSPDSALIASASLDHTVRVWQAASGYTVFVYTGHADQVNGVAWSPDGIYLASASSDHTVQVWEARTGKQIFTYTGHSASVNSVSWSPDGSLVASGGADYSVQVWKSGA